MRMQKRNAADGQGWWNKGAAATNQTRKRVPGQIAKKPAHPRRICARMQEGNPVRWGRTKVLGQKGSDLTEQSQGRQSEARRNLHIHEGFARGCTRGTLRTDKGGGTKERQLDHTRNRMARRTPSKLAHPRESRVRMQKGNAADGQGW